MCTTDPTGSRTKEALISSVTTEAQPWIRVLLVSTEKTSRSFNGPLQKNDPSDMHPAPIDSTASKY